MMYVIMYLIIALLYFVIRWSLIKHQIRKKGKCYLIWLPGDGANELFFDWCSHYYLISNSTFAFIALHALIWPFSLLCMFVTYAVFTTCFLYCFTEDHLHNSLRKQADLFKADMKAAEDAMAAEAAEEEPKSVTPCTCFSK